jgi:hypothetical protein
VISYQVYKLVHLFGMFALFTAVGGIALHAMNGGTRTSNTGRVLMASMHGVALFLILLGGFGMLARLGVVQAGLPGWVIAKLVIWGLLIAIAMLPYRRPSSARWVLLSLPFIGAAAGYIALYKPF